MKLKMPQRNALPTGDFALPGRRFPIPDANHGRAALSTAHNATPSEQEMIRAKVKAKFPGIKQQWWKRSK